MEETEVIIKRIENTTVPVIVYVPEGEKLSQLALLF
jgi:hypothetical protein